MMKTIRALLALLLLAVPALAQVGQIGSGTVVGNASASRAPATQATLTSLIDRALGSTQGSMLYRNATVWTPLTPGTAGLPLLSGGAAANLAYGILGAAAGGTGINNGSFTETRAGNLSLPAVAQGDLWYGSAAGTISALAKTASASQFIKNSGTSNNPAWAQPAIADISGWGTNVATALGVNVGTAGSVVVNGGALGTPSSGTLTNASGLPLAGLATQAANTVVGNATSGVASPTALAVGSCSTSASALIWTTNTGFGCNTSITAATNANLTGPITSTGNATAVASQTGTGTKFVMDTSPALVTPNIGVAVGTSLNLGGGAAGAGIITASGAGLNGILSGFQTDGASSTSGAGGFDAKSDTSEILFLANGSARTTVRYGLTIGGYGEFSIFDNGAGTNGLIIGVQPAKPIIFGTNNLVRMRLMGTSNHLAPEGTAPALTSCGTGSPTISGTDQAGEVTMGTSATGCVITFNVAYGTVPYCVVTWPAQALASQSYSLSASAITLTQTSTSGNKAYYHCTARSGG